MKCNGAEILINCLKEQGVDTIFGYPGGTVLDIYDALYRDGTIRHVITSHEQGAAHAAEGGFSTATDVADYLSKKGVPFRDAHAITGKIVRYCIEHNKTLRDLSLKEFKAVSDVFERDVTGVVLARTSAEARNSVGGSSQTAARKALIRIRNRLKHFG